MVPLTEQAHQFLAGLLYPGDIAIDATAGNGHDTLFLARQVGERGRVISLDVQSQALDITAKRLRDMGIGNVTLLQRNHAELDHTDILSAEDHGQVAAVMFNLGYLPGGNKSVKTAAESSAIAVAKALRLLRPGGAVSIISYVGHPGGREETQAVERILRRTTGAGYRLVQAPSEPAGTGTQPRWYVVQRSAGAT